MQTINTYTAKVDLDASDHMGQWPELSAGHELGGWSENKNKNVAIINSYWFKCGCYPKCGGYGKNDPYLHCPMVDIY